MTVVQEIQVSQFVLRQTWESKFSHYDGPWESLVEVTQLAFNNGYVEFGYRPGVVLVSVPAEGFFSGVVQLEEGDTLGGAFESRKEGEEPRKSIVAGHGKGKIPAHHVDIVLYSHEVLVENNEQSCDANWEIISINACPTEEEMPMHPDTLMANHYQISGGTATGMSNDEFVAALEKSFIYWQDKAMKG
jgi:hypothetical protein